MAETADIKSQIVHGDLPENELEEIIRLAIAQRNKKRGIVISFSMAGNIFAVKSVYIRIKTDLFCHILAVFPSILL